LEIHFDDGRKWQTVFPNERVSKTALEKLNFVDCCDSLEVYYNGPLEYTLAPIYGYYVRQEELIHGRPWYKNDGRSIWWDVKNDVWLLGDTTQKGSSSAFAYLDKDGRCFPKISNQKWKIFLPPPPAPWIDAGNKVKVRCGYKPKGYGTSMCCSRISVTLNGVLKDKQGGFAGTYQKASGFINNRSHWIKNDGEDALWYDIINNNWKIGFSSDLGSDIGGISSVQDAACPTSGNLFKNSYGAANKWKLAPINSVSIECV